MKLIYNINAEKMGELMRLQNFLKKFHQDTTATRMVSASKTHPIGLFFAQFGTFIKIRGDDSSSTKEPLKQL